MDTELLKLQESNETFARGQLVPIEAQNSERWVAFKTTFGDLVLINDELANARGLDRGQLGELVLSKIDLLQVLESLVVLAQQVDVLDLVASSVQLVKVVQGLESVQALEGVLIQVDDSQELELLNVAFTLSFAWVDVDELSDWWVLLLHLQVGKGIRRAIGSSLQMLQTRLNQLGLENNSWFFRFGWVLLTSTSVGHVRIQIILYLK